MLVTIQQTRSNFENLFEVSSDGRTLFHAKAPWMKVPLPFNTENIRELTFTDTLGENPLTAHYKMIEEGITSE